jgi:hypothetical protein
MKRHHDEVNTHPVRRSSVACLVIGVALLATASCGGRERRADRLWRQAEERVEKGDTEGAVVLMQKLIDDYPDATIASKARDQIVLYRGLAHAVQTYPARRARETMIQIARAIESFRASAHRSPATLDELTPGKLASIPVDPWGHAFAYELAGRGYRLRCNGADGAVGGTGEAEDIVVVDGAFQAAAP